MKISDICDQVPRLQVTNSKTGQWSWGSGFWATDGTKTKLVTAAHLWQNIGGQIPQVDLEYETPGQQTSVFLQGVSVHFCGEDMAQLDVPPPPSVIPFNISTALIPSRALVVAIGYGGSLNQSNGPGMPLDSNHVMLARGRFIAVHSSLATQTKAAFKGLEIGMMMEPGFSGGPLFIANAVPGGIDSNVLDLEIANIRSGSVVALCCGAMEKNPDHVGFETMHTF